MSRNPKISIIIPVKEINDYVREAVPHHMQLDYPDFEVLIFPDESSGETFPYSNVRIIPSGKTGPAQKRDMALKYAQGEIFAFIDDDAWPRQDWLKNAARELEDPRVGAAGGPAVTAPGDSLLQEAGGRVYESFLCSGRYVYRYVPKQRREDDDLPSVNLVVKREVFAQVHGFDSNFYPGEDTKLCMDIVNTGRKLIYSPDILVYHHRRKLFKQHLKQASNYALHRGYFAKKLPQTSLRPVYFVPTAFTAGLIAGPVLSTFFPALWRVYAGVLALYAALVAYSLRSCRSVRLFFLSFAGILATHVSYGVCFVRGLFSKELVR